MNSAHLWIVSSSRRTSRLINPFVPNAPFLYHLKISENLTVFCFQGVQKECIGSEWVKPVEIKWKINWKRLKTLLTFQSIMQLQIIMQQRHILNQYHFSKTLIYEWHLFMVCITCSKRKIQNLKNAVVRRYHKYSPW